MIYTGKGTSFTRANSANDFWVTEPPRDCKQNLTALTEHLSFSMRTLGILGGLGPESTIDYYRAILARYREITNNREYPHVLINSLDVDRGIAMLDVGRLDELTDYLSLGIEQLVRAGADFACMAANTPHLAFDDVQRRSRIPLLSIVHATAEHARRLGMKKLGLLGTGFTMRANFYPREFQSAGMALVVPTEAEREFIHRKYIGELLKNKFSPETGKEILRIVERLRAEEKVEAVVLAGTELPLLLRGSDSGIPFLDTTIIHVEAIVGELLR